MSSHQNQSVDQTNNEDDIFDHNMNDDREHTISAFSAMNVPSITKPDFRYVFQNNEKRWCVCVFVLVASNMRHAEDFHNQIDMSDIGQYSYYIVLLLLLLLYMDRIPSMIRNLLVCS